MVVVVVVPSRCKGAEGGGVVTAGGPKKKEGAGEPVGDGSGEGGAAALVVDPEGPRI
jgi:hypothetical protein